MPARPAATGSTQVVCPDKKASCPTGQTCCLLKGGVWGCCPMPKVGGHADVLGQRMGWLW